MKCLMHLALLLIVLFGSALQAATVDGHYESAAKKCQILKCVRNHIDKINMQLLDLMAKRTAFVLRAGDIKLHTGKALDEKRIQRQLATLAEEGEKRALPRFLTKKTFEALIRSSTQYEQTLMDQKKLKSAP